MPSIVGEMNKIYSFIHSNIHIDYIFFIFCYFVPKYEIYLYCYFSSYFKNNLLWFLLALYQWCNSSEFHYNILYKYSTNLTVQYCCFQQYLCLHLLHQILKADVCWAVEIKYNCFIGNGLPRQWKHQFVLWSDNRVISPAHYGFLHCSFLAGNPKWRCVGRPGR